MTDAQSLPTKSWEEFKSAEEANKEYKLPPEDAGYVLRIEELPTPTQSPFENRNDKGELRSPRFQSLVRFTIVDYHDPAFIGETLKQFFSISMHTKANFYKLVKAAMGGDVSPTWKPNAADLEGKLIVATITHKEPNDKGQVFPKIEASVTPYRGKKSYSDVVAGDTEAPVDAGDVPF